MPDSVRDTQPTRRQPEGAEHTRPSPSTQARQGRGSGGAPPSGEKPRKPRFGWMRKAWVQASLAAALALFLVTAASAAAGWSSGRSIFSATATIEAGFYMLEQYNLALADIDAGQYELARQRLEFIYFENPDFLDVAQKWVEVSVILGQTPQATSAALGTPSPTPTQDPRPKEELMAAAQGHLAAREWTNAIDTLLALRKADPNYETARVDGMLYAALRNRGAQHIIELGLFEQGLYDFSLAEKFGPLDGQAANYQQWARLYLYGNAFWLAYPQDAAYYYGQLVGLAPDLRDSSGLSAFYRYWQSLVHYADQLALQEEWCAASEQYQNAQSARADGGIQPTADYVLQQCIALTPSATATVTGSPTLGPTGTFTPTGSASATSGPTATSTPTSSGPTDTFTPTFTPSPTSTPTPTPTPTP